MHIERTGLWGVHGCIANRSSLFYSCAVIGWGQKWVSCDWLRSEGWVHCDWLLLSVCLGWVLAVCYILTLRNSSFSNVKIEWKMEWKWSKKCWTVWTRLFPNFWYKFWVLKWDFQFRLTWYTGSLIVPSLLPLRMTSQTMTSWSPWGPPPSCKKEWQIYFLKGSKICQINLSPHSFQVKT